MTSYNRITLPKIFQVVLNHTSYFNLSLFIGIYKKYNEDIELTVQCPRY